MDYQIALQKAKNLVGKEVDLWIRTNHIDVYITGILKYYEFLDQVPFFALEFEDNELASFDESTIDTVHDTDLWITDK